MDDGETPGRGRSRRTDREQDQFHVDISEVEPLDSYGITTITVGSVAWLVAFVLMLPFYTQLAHADRLWWLWTCLAGFGLGMYALEMARWRRKRELSPKSSSTGKGSKRAGSRRRRRS